MYDVDVFVYGPEGEDLGFKRVCSKEEVEQILRCYDSSEVSIKEIPNAKLSESKETCFCPHCMRMEFVKEKNKVYTCKECGKRFFVNI